MRVFLDANVLFTAAHNPGGKAAFVVELGAAGYFPLLTCDAAREEVERNLYVKYPASLPRLAAILGHVSSVAPDISLPVPDGLPGNDAVIFQAAVAGHATHFLTGDQRHFGSLMNKPALTGAIVVQTVAEFLAAL